MMGARISVLVLLTFTLLCGAAVGEASPPLKVSDIHVQLAKRHLEAGHPFWAIHSYRRALESGADNPNIHRQLAQVLYDLGFADQAISEMDLALKKAGNEDFLHMEMGVFCLASGKIQRALHEFTRVLELNAGFSYGYYYLSEVYYRLADYEHAAAALVLAQKLGLPGFEMERKLKDIGWQLPRQPWKNHSNNYCLRQIILENETDANDVHQRLQDGELFEELARQLSHAPEAANGGYIGTIELASMPEDIARKLSHVEIFAPPMLLHSGDKYIIVQRIAPFNAEMWRKKSGDDAKKEQPRLLPQQNHKRVEVNEKKPYVLLSGVFHNRSYADERVTRLRSLGLESSLQARGSGEHLRYEVIVGRYSHYNAAEKVGGKIVASGLDFYIRKEN